MKKLIINGVELVYDERNVDQKTSLLFIHGNSHAHTSFNMQFDSELLKNFRLIFINLPGHGGSDNVESYSLPLYAQLVAGLIETLNLSEVILVGHSLGGHVALHTLQLLTPDGIFIYGTPPLKKPLDFSGFLPNDKARALHQEICTEEEIEDFVTELKYINEQKSLAIHNFLKTDPRVRTGILSSVLNDNYSDECELIRQYKGKLMVLVSESENLVNNDYIAVATEGIRVETKSIIAGHAPHVEKFAEFNEILASFCQNVFSVSSIINPRATDLEVTL